MNHTKTVLSMAPQLALARTLSTRTLPFVLGETNSLYNQGAPGLSDSFGAALWSLDFNLWCAANNVSRVHMHQGTNFRYSSWQPIAAKVAVGTRPAYYANVAVAAMIGDSGPAKTQVLTLPLPTYSETQIAYAAYESAALKRVLLINMQAWNTTSASPTTPRPETTYYFAAPLQCAGNATVSRLMASGSDAVVGVSWNGYSYAHEQDLGKPRLLGNVSHDESLTVSPFGTFKLDVPHSSAAMVSLNCR
jgi:Glycosyl hydrolase family 79 C-terminal beta domain